MLTHQADSLSIGRGCSALADKLERFFVGVLQPEQKARPSCLLVEMEDVGVANDVVGPCRSDQDEVDVFCDQGLQKREPNFLRNGRIFVGEIDHLDAMLAVEARQFLCEQDGIAMAPSRPEAALSAIVAEVRATARELDYHGP